MQNKAKDLLRKAQDQEALRDLQDGAERLAQLVEALKGAGPNSHLGKAARAIYEETGRELSDELSQLASIISSNAQFLEG